jgi:hypothetical protein
MGREAPGSRRVELRFKERRCRKGLLSGRVGVVVNTTSSFCP